MFYCFLRFVFNSLLLTWTFFAALKFELVDCVVCCSYYCNSFFNSPFIFFLLPVFFSKLGATDHLIVLFQRATGVYEEAVDQRSSILSDSSELSYIEGVRLEDLIELLLVALHSVAQHSAARMSLVQATDGVFSSFVRVGVPITFVHSKFPQIQWNEKSVQNNRFLLWWTDYFLPFQYLYSNSEFLRGASLGLLNEISVCPEGCVAIENEGAIPRITELVQSSNPKIG